MNDFLSYSLQLNLLLPLLAAFLLIEGLFSGSEIALLSADRLELQKRSKNSRGARLALELATHPERVFSTTLFVNSLCVISISLLVSIYLIGRLHNPSELLSIVICSPLIVIFGELIPKTLFQRFALKFAPFSSYPVTFAFYLFYPFTFFLSAYTTRLSNFVGPVEELLAGKRKTTRERLGSLLNYSRKETELSGSERRMIRRILDFKESEAKHALIPLVRVEAVEIHLSVSEALKRFELHRHSRMPVFEGRVDNIVGVLEYRDLFSAADLELPIRHFVSAAHYVAEAQSLLDVLIQMKERDDKMVVVVDEHGGGVGVLTFEDIVEEIVGEIQDEYDGEAQVYKELSEGKWLVQAKMEIVALNEGLKINLPEGDYETLSGFLLQQFGRIPEARDELFFNTSSAKLRFAIQSASERQIHSVLIEMLP